MRRADRKAVSVLHGFRVHRGASMDADVGISKKAVAALVAATIAVGALGTLLGHAGAPAPTADQAPATPGQQSR